MLPFLYPDPATRDALLANPQTAPIPELHRELFAFAETFVRGSWKATPDGLQRLRAAGLPEAEIVRWATFGSTQSWFTMSADGGGVPLDGDATTGPAVGRTRESYEATREGLLAAPDEAADASAVPGSGVAWVETDEANEAYGEAARQAEARYGGVPNLLRAVSLVPDFYRRHLLALELLEAPQSASLSPRQHARVRALVSQLNRSPYGEVTSAALLSREGGPGSGAAESPADRAVLGLATKLARNAYKVTEKDAIGLREAGLDDEAYVDVLNTVAIQTSLERLANVLGVQPDSFPLLPRP